MQASFSRITFFWVDSALYLFEFEFSRSSDQFPGVFGASVIFGVWLLAPRIALPELSMLPYYLSHGFRSLKSFSLVQQRHFIIRVMDFDPSNHSFRASSASIKFEIRLRFLELFC
jgi:hypothetical protein